MMSSRADWCSSRDVRSSANTIQSAVKSLTQRAKAQSTRISARENPKEPVIECPHSLHHEIYTGSANGFDGDEPGTIPAQ